MSLNDLVNDAIERKQKALEIAVEVKDKYAGELMGIDGVEGVGVGADWRGPVVSIFVSAHGLKLPKKLDGVRTKIVYSGKFVTY